MRHQGPRKDPNNQNTDYCLTQRTYRNQSVRISSTLCLGAPQNKMTVRALKVKIKNQNILLLKMFTHKKKRREKHQ